MPRPKTRPDAEVLEIALGLIHDGGPRALTFERLARASGLSGATLVQRFGGKAGLRQSTLLHAWDALDARTAERAASVPRTPAGAVALLVGLSGSFGDIETYADGLLVLREDLRDPVLRARGAAWKAELTRALDACFATTPGAPPGAGLLIATHWQGTLLWWSFEPEGDVAGAVAASLERFVATLCPPR